MRVPKALMEIHLDQHKPEKCYYCQESYEKGEIKAHFNFCKMKKRFKPASPVEMLLKTKEDWRQGGIQPRSSKKLLKGNHFMRGMKRQTIFGKQAQRSQKNTRYSDKFGERRFSQHARTKQNFFSGGRSQGKFYQTSGRGFGQGEGEEANPGKYFS